MADFDQARSLILASNEGQSSRDVRFKGDLRADDREAATDPDVLARRGLIDIQEAEAGPEGVGVGEDLLANFDEFSVDLAQVDQDISEFEHTTPEGPKSYGEKAGAEGAAMASELVGGDFNIIADQLSMVGDSPDYQAAKQAAKNQKNLAIEREAQLEISEGADLGYLKQLQEKWEAEGDMETEALVSINAKRMPDSPREETLMDARREAFLDRLDANINSDKELRDFVAQRADESGWTTGEMIADFGGVVVPFATSITTKRFIEEFLPSRMDTAAIFVPGEYDKALRDYFGGLPIDERLPFAQDFDRFLSSNAGIFGHNDMARTMKWNSVIGEAMRTADTESIDWDRWIEDVIGLTDAWIVGGWVKGGAKLIGRAFAKRSTMSKMTEANPELAADIAERSLQGDANAARMAGETPEETMSQQMMPKLEGVEVHDAPQTAQKVLEKADEVTSDVIGRVDRLVEVFQPGEIKEFAKVVLKAKEELVGAVAKHGTSTVEKLKDGVRYAATYGKSAQFGFESAGEALKRARQLFPEGDISIVERSLQSPVIRKVASVKSDEAANIARISDTLEKQAVRSSGKTKALKDEVKALKKQLSSAKGKAKTSLLKDIKKVESQLRVDSLATTAKKNLDALEKGDLSAMTPKIRASVEKLQPKSIGVSEGAGSKSEFYFKVSNDYKLAADSSVVFPEGTVVVGGRSAKYIADGASKLSKWFSQQWEGAFDVSKGIERDLFQVIEGNFATLNNNSKKIVTDLLTQGAKAEKTFDVNTLKGRLSESGLSGKALDDAMAGYYGMRKLMDSLYVLNNKRLRDRLELDGMKRLTSGDYQGAARPLTPIQAGNVEQVYDPVGKAFVKLGSKEIDDVYRNGGFIAKNGIKGEAGETHVLIKSDFKLDALPEQVLKYNDGYLTRYYRDPYWIEGTRVVNGKSVTKVVASTGDLASAQKAAISLNSQADGLKYVPRHEKRLTQEESQRFFVDSEVSNGGVFFSTRRNTAVESLTLGVENMEDPLATVARAVSSTAHGLVYDNMMLVNKNRWINTWGDLVPSSKGPRFPDSVQEISTKDLSEAGRKRAADAVAMYEHITMQAGMKSEFADAYKRLFVGLADSLGQRGAGSRVTNAVLTAGEKDPMSIARAASFMTLVALNPFRQAWLQTQQVLYLTGIKGATPYMASGKMSLDWMGMTIGMMPIVKGKADDWAPWAAKRMGLSVDEYKKTVKAFKDSGLTATIDQHLLGRDAAMKWSRELQPNQVRSGLQSVMNGLKSVPMGVKQVGFDFGEYNTLLTSWLTAQNRWKLANPGKDALSDAALRDINRDARSFALSMTKPGAFAYQEGFLSLMTQFWAVQHKAWLGMSWKSNFGNQAISKEERFRIAVSQLFLYGATGWGMHEAVESITDSLGIDLPDWARDFAIGGIYEGAINSSLRAVSDEQGLRVSESAAAASGMANTIANTFTAIFTDDKTPLEFFLGASGTVHDRFSKAIQTSGDILSLDEPNMDDIGRMIDAWGTASSTGWSNYMNASVQHRIGAIVDKRGDPIAKATLASAIARGVFGVRTVRGHEFYKTAKEFSQVKKDLKEDAQNYYELVRGIVNRAVRDNPQGIGEEAERFSREAIRMQNARVAMLAEDDKKLWKEEFGKLVRRRRQENAQDDLIHDLGKYAMHIGSPGDSTERIITMMKRAGATEEEIKDVKTVIEYPFKESNE